MAARSPRVTAPPAAARAPERAARVPARASPALASRSVTAARRRRVRAEPVTETALSVAATRCPAPQAKDQISDPR
jgi:hypothetical protein